MSLTEIKASIDPVCTKSPRLGDSPLYLYAAMLTRKFSQSYASRCSYRSVSPPAPASIIVDSPCRNDIAFHRFPLFSSHGCLRAHFVLWGNRVYFCINKGIR